MNFEFKVQLLKIVSCVEKYNHIRFIAGFLFSMPFENEYKIE